MKKKMENGSYMQKRKQIRKRISARICVALFGVMFAGCSHSAAEKSGLDTEQRESGHEGYIVVGYAQVGSESDWRTTNTESFKEVFTAENGYYLIFEDGQQKQENQVKAVRNFILQEVDYIVLDPIVETGWEAVLQEAKEAGIPVILSDRKVEVEDESLYTCWVGSDFEEEGRKAGKWLENYLAKLGKEDETINIVTLQGTLNSSAQIGRTEGFDEILSQHENWVMLDQQSGDFTQAKAQEVMEEFLENYEQIDVVISENDNMTFGAIQAIKEAGKEIGPDGDMIILSFDAVEDSFDAMERGEIVADFECNPLLAPLVEDVIWQLEQGKEVEKIQYVEETYFDYQMDLEGIRKSRTY
ncbi:MAG: ABC transporter substrate-binding protein [Roseburia sp.]